MKLVLDRVIGISAFILLFPMMLVVAAMVWFTLGAPILYKQVRPGFRERLFVLYKFRTMQDSYTSDGLPCPDEDRLTGFGRRLRSMSLDELPQLWNVIRGDLSIVGPRPLLPEYLERYTPVQRARHQVRPGMTGWAQIRGRNAIGWSEKFELDRWYVQNWTFWLDLRIIAITALELLRPGRAAHPGHASMPPFMGDGGASEREAAEREDPGGE